MPMQQLLQQFYTRNRQGVGGVRPRIQEDLGPKDYHPERVTDAYDNRHLGKYFRVGMTSRR